MASALKSIPENKQQCNAAKHTQKKAVGFQAPHLPAIIFTVVLVGLILTALFIGIIPLLHQFLLILSFLMLIYT
jgi:hypothetical protein